MGLELCEQRELVVATDWLDQQCAAPGCNVVIRSRAGAQHAGTPVCKWCQSNTAYYRRPPATVGPKGGPVITREEFGADLYDAILLRAASVTAARLAERQRAQGHVKAAAKNEQASRVSESAVAKLLDKGTIDPADIRRLLAVK